MLGDEYLGYANLKPLIISCSDSSSSHAAVLFATAGMGLAGAHATVLASSKKANSCKDVFKDIFALSSLFYLKNIEGTPPVSSHGQ